MTPLLALVIGLGGGLGAVARWALDRAMATLGGSFPLGILVVNLSGSLLIGVLDGAALAVGAAADAGWVLALGGGVIGGYTTFSTAMVDTVRLLGERRGGAALLNAAGTVVGAVLAVLLGVVVGAAIAG
ncbi:fluoride efflux transporter CrcB [Mycetocola reblochoni]|uniref:Fluoride-specific ion channel FluC n=2 Tax=Mycetocola reblochoni TaxID=331618 RepID=A0A1R4IFN5_9MICO|nr:fluoride efflux transporter CrcB [Mycetocola reblochoni]RLP68985.1 fluoride efflux transporter CrcB [Mycetocola reblochoni]SJN18589.1 CrcB protein [Mycetocola reblochoni REB411]